MEIFENNMAHIFVYKSDRRNAGIVKLIPVNHLISRSADRKLDDDRIVRSFISAMDEILH